MSSRHPGTHLVNLLIVPTKNGKVDLPFINAIELVNSTKMWAIEKKDNSGKFFALQPASDTVNQHQLVVSNFSPLSDWQVFLKKEKDWGLIKK